MYPGIIALIVSSLSYPLGTGQFIAGELSTHEQVHQLFSNFTWTKKDLTVEQATIVNEWSTDYTDVFFHLGAFLLYTVSNYYYPLKMYFKQILNEKKIIPVHILYHRINDTSAIRNVYSSFQNWSRNGEDRW